MNNEDLNGKTIAANIRAERNRTKLTQEYVADKLGISNKTYISYERDAKSVEAMTLYKLSIIFGCNIMSFYLNNNST